MELAGIRVAIKNIRSISAATLQLQPGLRTILIGRNNCGKTTLIESAARALWSLPAPSTWQGPTMSESWYRRTDGKFNQPELELSIPPSLIHPDLCAHAATTLNAELVAETPASRVNLGSKKGARLVVNKMWLDASGDRRDLIVPAAHSPTTSAWDAVLMVDPAFLSEGNTWTNLDVGNARGHQSSDPQSLYGANVPLTRALAQFMASVFYLPAGRLPNFEPASTLTAISQSDLTNMTGLLLKLQALKQSAIAELSIAVALLFPETKRLGFDAIDSMVVPKIDFVDGRSEYVANLGFGFQNAVHILTLLSVVPTNAVLFVDEPEKGLNQACQREFAALLEVHRPDVTLVVATQSESFVRGFSTRSAILLVENASGASCCRPMKVADSVDDLREVARVMGIDPLFLCENGRIIYVEGASDKPIVEAWLKLNLGSISGYQIESLGGCGNVNQAFVKPLIERFRDRVFLLLDSDRRDEAAAYGPEVRRLVDWLKDKRVDNHYVLRRPEIENYLPAESLAEATDVRVSVFRPTPGQEAWFDIKRAFRDAKGFEYDTRRTVDAFESLPVDAKRNLFAEENATLLEKLRTFLSMSLASH